MLSYVYLGTNDLERAIAFYTAALAPLGMKRCITGDPRDTTTPAAMAQTLHRFVLGRVLSEPSRTTFTGWLVGCQTGDNRLRAGLPNTWVIGDKTGNNGNDAAGDIAVVWPKADIPIVICVYTRGGSPSARQFESAFAGIGRFVGAQLFKGTRGDREAFAQPQWYSGRSAARCSLTATLSHNLGRAEDASGYGLARQLWP